MAIKDQIAFGIGTTEAAGLTTTESVSITTRIDKTEAYLENGEYACVRFYNPHGEFTATGYGITTAKALISVLATASDIAGLDPDDNSSESANASKIYVNSIAKEESNEDFQKTTISGVFYGGINTA
tara:strand:- start:1296 stop:1676 length:381 start_codon:yes stop_codon:yes gene_type:complete